MYKLTQRREAKALPILDGAYASLANRGRFDVHALERELRECWNVGYHELYQILEDSFRNDRWRYVSVYYMERVQPALTMELRHALTKAYGVRRGSAKSEWDACRMKFWKQSGIKVV